MQSVESLIYKASLQELIQTVSKNKFLFVSVVSFLFPLLVESVLNALFCDKYGIKL